MNDWLQVLTQGDLDGGVAIGPQTTLLVLLLSFSIGHIIGWTYIWTHHGISYSRGFASSMVAIPVLVALIMTLMAGNIVVAFGLLAVFAVVRFRNVLKDTRDTTFVLWAIVQGMAVGTLRFSSAIMGCLFVALLYVYLRTTSFGGRLMHDAVLMLRLSGGPTTDEALQGILRSHSLRAQLASRRNLPGNERDLSYRLLLRDPARGDELVSALESADGVAEVTLHHRGEEEEL